MFRVGEKVKLKWCDSVYTICSFNKREFISGNTVEFSERNGKSYSGWDMQRNLIKIYQPGEQLLFAFAKE